MLRELPGSGAAWPPPPSAPPPPGEDFWVVRFGLPLSFPGSPSPWRSERLWI